MAVIGITTRRLAVGKLSLDVVDRAYGIALANAGALPRLLVCPPEPELLGANVLAGLDGLLLSGGGDVDPAKYGDNRFTETGGVDEARDIWEIGLVRRALEASLPILAICRGCQILNVALGGTLLQHLPHVTSLSHLVPEPRDQIVHTVELDPSSQLASILRRKEIGVNSIHHQAISVTGAGLRPTAQAEDGIIEAIEIRDHPVIGVQWHPENLTGLGPHFGLFEWLTQQATAATTRDHCHNPSNRNDDSVSAPTRKRPDG